MNKLLRRAEEKALRGPERTAFRFCWKKDGEWLATSRAEFVAQNKVDAKALCAMGLLEKDTIAVCSPDTP